MSLRDKNLSGPARPDSRYRYLAVFLIAMAITINYIDRINLSVAAPTLMAEFGLTASQMGVLMSAFFWSYTLMMIPVGALLNKFGPKLLMFFSCLGWGLVTMLTALVSGFGSLLAVRIGLGVTEAASYPSAPRVVSVWVPKRERTMASAAFDCCARLGNAFAPPLVALVIVAWGWKASFLVSGVLAVIYSFIWLYSYKDPDEHPKVTKEELDYIRQDEVLSEAGQVVVKPIPLLKLFSYPMILQLCCGYALYMYFWTTFNAWIPSYMMNVCGLSLTAMGFAAMLPYIAGVLMELLGGFVFDRWFRRGATITLSPDRDGRRHDRRGGFPLHGYSGGSPFTGEDHLLADLLHGNFLLRGFQCLGHSQRCSSLRPGGRGGWNLQLHRQFGLPAGSHCHRNSGGFGLRL